MSYISIGTFVNDRRLTSEPIVQCNHPPLDLHWRHGNYRYWLAKNYGVTWPTPLSRRAFLAQLGEDERRRGLIIPGQIGVGKSKSIEVITSASLREGASQDGGSGDGASALIIEPKRQGVMSAVHSAFEAGLDPAQVTLLSPQFDYVPGLNILASDIPLAQAAGDLVALIESGSPYPMPRLADVITNAAVLVGSHGLSVLELIRVLTVDAYRKNLLTKPVSPSDPTALAEALNFYNYEFDVWNRSERAGAVAPALRRLRSMLQGSFLKACLTARSKPISFARLFDEQRVIIAHIDAPSLGDTGARLLAGILVSGLFRTAMRSNGTVPVVLQLDEAAIAERLVGSAIEDSVLFARSQGIRVVLAFQHCQMLSESLRNTLLAATAIKLAFRLGSSDAHLIASALAMGAPPVLRRLVIDPPTTAMAGNAPFTVRLKVRNAQGQPLRMSAEAWRKLGGGEALSGEKLPALDVELRRAGAGRVYVRAVDTREPTPLLQYVVGLPLPDISVTGPVPLRLVIRIPQHRVTIERQSETEQARVLAQVLQTLPNQHALLSVYGKNLGVVRITDRPDPVLSPKFDAYLQAVLAANGQSPREIADTARWREAQVAAIAAGRDLNLADTNVSRPTILDHSYAMPKTEEITAGQGSDLEGANADDSIE